MTISLNTLLILISLLLSKGFQQGNDNPVKPAFIVPDNGTVADAFNAAQARQDTTARFVIFIRNGSYQLSGDKGKTIRVEGVDYPSPITTLSAPNVSIIGESMDSTILWNNPEHEGIDITATLLLDPRAINTIIENLTLKNAYEYNERNFAGRAVALQDQSTGTICRRVKLLSHQDTYYSNNNAGDFLFEDCELHGTVDFICGGGDVLFRHCRIVLEDRNKADCVTAPGVPRKNGYVFVDCTIDGSPSQDGRYSLGRAWKDGSRCQYIRTRMNIIPRKEGWTVMRDYIHPGRMAEYGSTDHQGNNVDMSARRSVWGNDSLRVNINPLLSPQEAEQLATGHF